MQHTTKEFTVSEDHNGLRLDLFLVEQLSCSRNVVKQYIDRGQVLRNNVLPKKAGDIVHTADLVVIQPLVITETKEEVQEDTKAQQALLEAVQVIADTPDYVVIYKPAGLLMHANDHHDSVTVVAWLQKHYPEVVGVGDNLQRPGIVHRLDKDASGILVVAKNQEMFDNLKQQFKTRSVKKEYIVLVHGQFENDEGSIDFPIDRSKDGKFVARPAKGNRDTAPSGKDAYTEWQVETRYLHYTLLKVRIHTGRTHQIRVHMYANAHPVVGDTLYMQRSFLRYNNLPRLFLHAARLSFADKEGTIVSYEHPLPEELISFLAHARPYVS